MSTPLMTFAVGLTRWWVQLYTRGVSPEQKDARRAEIESDVWEHGAGNGADGVGPETTALQVLGRLLLGVPADLSWRLEQRGARGRAAKAHHGSLGRSGKMIGAMTRRGVPVLTALLAGFYVIPSLFVLFGGGDFDSDAVRVVYGIVGVLAGVAILTGLLISSRSPWLSAGLVAGGAVVMAVFWFWFFYVLVPVTLLVVGFAIARARRGSDQRALPA